MPTRQSLQCRRITVRRNDHDHSRRLLTLFCTRDQGGGIAATVASRAPSLRGSYRWSSFGSKCWTPSDENFLGSFEVRKLIYDPYLSDWEAGALGVEKVSLNDLFATADIVTVHTPSIPQTNKMIGEEQLKLLRDGTTLVNTSRGSVIDHDALLAEARTGRIFITLDVTTPEPLPPDSPFLGLPNVFVTPHAPNRSSCAKSVSQHSQPGGFFADRPVVGAVKFQSVDLIGYPLSKFL